jgi:metallo-beta-lactamase family protein
VRARIVKIDSMSAHADAAEIQRWLGGFRTPPRRTFLVHGEPEPLAALERAIESRFGWAVHVPEHLEAVDLP